MSRPPEADPDDPDEDGPEVDDATPGDADAVDEDSADDLGDEDAFDPDELPTPADLEDLDTFDDDEDGDDEEEDVDEDDEDSDDGEGDEDKPRRPVAKKVKAKEEEEEPPGPDVPAPPVKKLLEAMRWAFEKEQVDPELLELFAEHAHLVLDANRSVNLTAIIDPKELAAKHYLDCWRMTQMMSLMGRTIVDLGSGAGFPGMLLAMSEPHCKVVLIDTRQKKADFVEMCIEKLGVKNAVSHCGKAEEYLALNRVDVVVARAVSSVRENVRTLRKVRHSLKDYVMLKGASWSREVRAGEREAERLGFILDTVWEYELPEDMGKRAILVYRAPGAM